MRMPQDKQLHNPGKLRTRFNIEVPDQKKDKTGAPYNDYPTKFKVWGNKIPNNGQEFFRSGKFSSEIDGLVEIRYRDDITPEHRVEEISTKKKLRIKAVFDATGDRRRLHLYYTEVN